jgi:hypothetical protein
MPRGPEGPAGIQQYFIEQNADVRPFDRGTRSIVCERAKGTDGGEPYGTGCDVYRPGTSSWCRPWPRSRCPTCRPECGSAAPTAPGASRRSCALTCSAGGSTPTPSAVTTNVPGPFGLVATPSR